MAQKLWQKPNHEGAVVWWDIARRTPYYEHILCAHIRAILRSEMTKRISEQANKQAELGKALTDLGTTLPCPPQLKQ